MPRRSPEIAISEIPGNLYPDLGAAQRAALKATAHDLAKILRSLLDTGQLVQVNGRIIPANSQR